MVMADLMRALPITVPMDWMAVSSYGSGTKSCGVVRILKDLDTDITGRHVLIVEDIIDSGLTLSWIMSNLRVAQPGLASRSARCCASRMPPRSRSTSSTSASTSRTSSSSATASTTPSATATCGCSAPWPPHVYSLTGARRALPSNPASRGAFGAERPRSLLGVYLSQTCVDHRDGRLTHRPGGPGRRAPHPHGRQAHLQDLPPSWVSRARPRADPDGVLLLRHRRLHHDHTAQAE